MTDNYGTESNPENGHDEVLIPEHDTVREPPSDYEFADEHGASAAEEQTEEQMTPGDVKLASRSPVLPIAAAGVVLLLGVGAWWHFGGASTASAPAVTPANMASARPMPVLSTSPKVQDTQPITEPVPSVTQPVATAPAPMVPSNGNNVASVVSATATPLSAQPSAVPVAVPPLPAVPSATPDQRIQELNARVDTLQKALDQANQQLAQVTNMVAADTSAPSVKDLQDRIDKLEQELAQSHEGARPALTSPAAASGAVVAVASPSVLAKKPALHHKVLPKGVKVHKEIDKSVVAAPSPWVLRAASPGHAWVAASSTSRDLKQLQVGDTFDGIGKVMAIDQQNGNWVVTGSKGHIQ